MAYSCVGRASRQLCEARGTTNGIAGVFLLMGNELVAALRVASVARCMWLYDNNSIMAWRRSQSLDISDVVVKESASCNKYRQSS